MSHEHRNHPRARGETSAGEGSGWPGKRPLTATLQCRARDDAAPDAIQLVPAGAGERAAPDADPFWYATGDDVAFSAPPDLETAAHEAAHVVQQRGGVQLKGGVGASGDVYERNADEVAAAVVRGESAAALLAPFAGGGAAAAPVVQRKTMRVEGKSNAAYHVRYEAAPQHLKAKGYQFVVYLPAGFEPARRALILEQLGLGEDGVFFTNEPRDDVDMTIAQDDKDGHATELRATVRLNHQAKVDIAKRLLRLYVAEHRVDGLDPDVIEKLLAQQPVTFYDRLDWERFNHGTPGLGTPEETEGLTHPGKPGARRLGINEHNHTTGAIVHELFHSMSHPDIESKLPGDLVEALTEFLALGATGLTLRKSRTGGAIYEDNVRVVKIALDRGAVTRAAIFRAYFLGDLDAIARLREGWRFYSRAHEKVEFIYTGKVPTQKDIDGLWESVEKFFG